EQPPCGLATGTLERGRGAGRCPVSKSIVRAPNEKRFYYRGTARDRPAQNGPGPISLKSEVIPFVWSSAVLKWRFLPLPIGYVARLPLSRNEVSRPNVALHSNRLETSRQFDARGDLRADLGLRLGASRAHAA